mgnify:CR=1 FL=1
MVNDNIMRCIICLEEEKKYVPMTKLFHVPCECHIYIHSSCFRQCNFDKCMVCKKDYSEEKMTEFYRVINNHYSSSYSNFYQSIICIMHLIGYVIIFFVVGLIVTLIGYGIGYMFSCVNVFLDKGYCNKKLFDESHIYIGLFILGIIMACRAEIQSRQINHRNRISS